MKTNCLKSQPLAIIVDLNLNALFHYETENNEMGHGSGKEFVILIVSVHSSSSSNLFLDPYDGSSNAFIVN